jgi:hypothetical protein
MAEQATLKVRLCASITLAVEYSITGTGVVKARPDLILKRKRGQ